MLIRSKKDWELPDHKISDEHAYLNRRRFLKSMGLGFASASVLASGLEYVLRSGKTGQPGRTLSAQQSDVYAADTLSLTDPYYPLHYNNFYEFSTDKRAVAFQAHNFSLDPYQLSIRGLVNKALTLNLEDILKLPLEERAYRFRCVEAWSMRIPWIGIPLSTLLMKAGVKQEARYVRFISFHDPLQAPGQRDPKYRWPYYEALHIDEAMHDLCFIAVGMYGKALAPQNGAPLRLVVPWKYGYKSAKSIVRIELISHKPSTFWNDLYPQEYGFTSNVDPSQPHPRWSQATERLIDTGEHIPTLPFNGYATEVAHLYNGTRT